LIRDEETPLAADAHTIEAGIPARDYLVLAVGDGDWVSARMIVRRVELSAVGQVAGVVDGVPLVRRGQFAGTDFCVDVVERDGGGLKTKSFAKARAFEWRDILELYSGLRNEGVERIGAGGTGGKRGNL